MEGAVNAVLEAWLAPYAPEQLREWVGAMQRRAFELQADPPETSDADDPLEEDPGLVGSLDIPALCLAGSDDMPDFVSSAKWLADVLPRARYAEIEGARHLAPVETPDAFRALVIEFLATNAEG